ncbi:hypothetical protein ACHAWO_005099 [Cyclotella atomus]|uniref:Uncharacterized protein n=1 Tax=Cyclotella atomus TaxID=382360 RepID=A0ABD3PKR9_9STRA
MGKKNLKRSDKSFKAIKNGTDKEMKAFLKWLEDQIWEDTLPPEVGLAIITMVFFWLETSRVEIFLGCCRSLELFAPVYCSKIQDLYDAGQFELARTWVITFHIASHLEKNLQYRGQTPEECQLANIVGWITTQTCFLANQTREQLMVSHDPLGNAYYYARSSRSHYALCWEVRDIQIFVGAETDLVNETSRKRVSINASIQLRTLVMIFTGGPISDYYVLVIGGKVSSEKFMGQKILSDEFHIRISDLTFGLICICRKSCRKSPNANDIRSKPISTRELLQKEKMEPNFSAVCEVKNPSDIPSKLKNRQFSSKKKSSRVNVNYSTNDDRLEHSNRLSLIFEEAADIFKECRQHLNDLAIKKSAPKQKSPINVQTHVDESEVVHHNTFCESKAGKTYFPVLIGHDEYLYKSSKASKLSQVSPCSLDLYGCTRDEALFKLSSSLPNWLDAAMKEHPYTLPVNIITGGGSQIVADAVEHWIRASRNVANRF